jgi:hypothetical protein
MEQHSLRNSTVRYSAICGFSGRCRAGFVVNFVDCFVDKARDKVGGAANAISLAAFATWR